MIVAAAIRIGDAVISMAAPARHHDILRQINRLYDPEPRPFWTFEAETQGFLTERGVFLDRREAYTHALECGQPLVGRRPDGYQGDELFSEDLW